MSRPANTRGRGHWRITTEVDSRYPQGRKRRRWIGHDRRGAPSRCSLDLDDARSTLREVAHAVELLVKVDGAPTMRRCESVELHKTALAKLALGVRFAEQAIDRPAPTPGTYRARPL